MLLQCPECQLPVSDKAFTCPHCGYPMQKSAQNSPPRKNRKSNHKRLPNGFGRITELKNRNLRNPYRAMITSGFSEDGKPIGKILGYYKTYNDAYSALAEYHKHPVDLDKRLTCNELYEKWSEEYFKNISANATRTVVAAWRYCHSAYDLRVDEVRSRHIKFCIEEGYVMDGDKKRMASANTKSRIKSTWNLMMDYAVEYELTDRNYARAFDLSKEVIKEKETATRQHLSFTDKEMEVLWKHTEDEIVNIILFQCYSGFRPQELGLIEVANVNIDDMYIIGGMKTEAGTNRIVPIHPRMQEFVKKIYHMAGSRKYLFDANGKLTYDKYNHRFRKVIAELGLNPEHRPHDCRKQFVTLAKKHNVDEYAIKRVVGHSITDITERVYTDRDIAWLKDEIAKIQ